MLSADSKRLIGASYQWVAPTGISLALNDAKPYLAGTSRVGKYKVTVSFSGSNQTCLLETDISATPCQTFTDGNCTGTTTPIKTDTPNENIANLAVGDVFNAGDYEVTVTKIIEGSQSAGFTGEGLVNQNLVANIQIPMTVTFDKIKINECYQYYNRGDNGANVITKFDPTWGNEENNELCGNLVVYALIIQEIADLVNVFESDDELRLQGLLNKLKLLKSQLIDDGCLNSDQKNQIFSAYDDTENIISCFLTSSSTRINNVECDPEIDKKLEKNVELILASNDKECNCTAPNGTGIEGTIIVKSGLKSYHDTFVPCYKKFVYHTSFTGSKFSSGWYFSEDYSDIVTFVKDKIGPLIFIHGTFSDPSAFSEDFKNSIYQNIEILSSTPLSKIISEVQWSGGNSSSARETAAQELFLILNSNLAHKILADIGFANHIILVCHSHGGNVAKLLKNKLELVDSSWLIDVINIETPQRNDVQSNSSKGQFLNFWSDGDFVQWLGSIADFDMNQPNPGPLGSRKDPKADFNIQLLSRTNIWAEDYGGNMYKWITNSLGHSLQGDNWYKAQIYYHINNYFKR